MGSPTSLATRLTLGHLIESLSSKAAVIAGKYVDATPFQALSLDAVYATMMTNGFHAHGLESFSSATTGLRLSTYIFLGITYFQRLKHMVLDKFHSRARGAIKSLTRQPN